MISMTITDFSRNMKEVLNQVEYQGQDVILVRNKRPVARLIPQPSGQGALDVMADVFATIGEGAAASWLEEARSGSSGSGMRDPWTT